MQVRNGGTIRSIDRKRPQPVRQRGDRHSPPHRLHPPRAQGRRPGDPRHPVGGHLRALPRAAPRRRLHPRCSRACPRTSARAHTGAMSFAARFTFATPTGTRNSPRPARSSTGPPGTPAGPRRAPPSSSSAQPPRSRPSWTTSRHGWPDEVTPARGHGGAAVPLRRTDTGHPAWTRRMKIAGPGGAPTRRPCHQAW
jgi:hypothetical protein